jgi:hypothetical protein
VLKEGKITQLALYKSSSDWHKGVSQFSMILRFITTFLVCPKLIFYLPKIKNLCSFSVKS